MKYALFLNGERYSDRVYEDGFGPLHEAEKAGLVDGKGELLTRVRRFTKAGCETRRIP